MDQLFRRGTRNVVKRVNVTPSTEDGKQFTTECNGLDAAFFLFPEVPIAFVWKNKQLDFESLRVGLERTLNRCPSAAGRVRAGKHAMEISCVGSEGCILEYQLENKMPSEDAPVSEWKQFGIPEPLIPREPFSTPLMSATLTHFQQGGCSLFVRFSHLLTDGAGIVKFMHMWSWETAMAGGDDLNTRTTEHVLPATRPNDLDCQRVFPAGARQERAPKLTQKDFSRRLSMGRVVRFMSTFAYANIKDEVTDFIFDSDAYESLKQRVQQSLEPGQWVSSFEAFMGLVLQCLAKAEGSKQLDCQAVVNLRGRSALFNENYFGIGLSVHEINSLSFDKDLSKVAFEIHQSLRTGLADTTNMEKLVMVPEVLQAHKTSKLSGLLGGRELVLERARYLTIWESCISENKCVLNSWVGYPWFDINFGMDGGQQSRPNFIRVPQEFRYRRHIHLCPMSETTFQLRMQLPPHVMHAFRQEFIHSGFKFRESTLMPGESESNDHHQVAKTPSMSECESKNDDTAEGRRRSKKSKHLSSTQDLPPTSNKREAALAPVASSML